MIVLAQLQITQNSAGLQLTSISFLTYKGGKKSKEHTSGSIERVSEYRSIEVSDTGTAGLVKYR